MIRYVPAAAAEPLSAALWELTRPVNERRENETTIALFSAIVDAQHSPWLVVPDDCRIRIHPQAVLGRIADILQPWIDGGHLPADTNEVLTALIESHLDQPLVVYDAFPQLFKDMSKTRAEMIAAGLLAEPTPA